MKLASPSLSSVVPINLREGSIIHHTHNTKMENDDILYNSTHRKPYSYRCGIPSSRVLPINTKLSGYLEYQEVNHCMCVYVMLMTT